MYIIIVTIRRPEKKRRASGTDQKVCCNGLLTGNGPIPLLEDPFILRSPSGFRMVLERNKLMKKRSHVSIERYNYAAFSELGLMELSWNPINNGWHKIVAIDVRRRLSKEG